MKEIERKIAEYNASHEKKLFFKCSYHCRNKSKPYNYVVEYDYCARPIQVVRMRTGILYAVDVNAKTMEFLDEFLETLH